MGLLYQINGNGMTPTENSPPILFPPPFTISLSLERAHGALRELERHFPFVTAKQWHAAALEAEEVQKKLNTEDAPREFQKDYISL